MRAGDVVVLRVSNEPAEVVAALDASGTLLLRVGDETFEASSEEWRTPADRLADCGCCG